MNRDDIARMMLEAGYSKYATGLASDDAWRQVERFTQAVYAAGAAAEREKLQRDGWRQCATGQRTTQFCGLLRQAVEAEREACAKVCDALPFLTAEQCATAIRMRGEK